MDLRELSNLYQTKLLEFFASSEGLDEAQIVSNANFLAYFFTEISKRWTDRKYWAKMHNDEDMTIEYAEKKSLEITMKFFRSQERKRAPAQLAESIDDSAELFAFLAQSQPKPDAESERPEERERDDEKEQEVEAELAEEPEQEPAKSIFGGAAAVPQDDGPEQYHVITPEELAQVRKR